VRTFFAINEHLPLAALRRARESEM